MECIRPLAPRQHLNACSTDFGMCPLLNIRCVYTVGVLCLLYIAIYIRCCEKAKDWSVLIRT